MSAKIIRKSNIIGVVILMLGVIFGVILVQQSQEYRERAASGDGESVTICYLNESTREWEEFNVGESQLNLFLDKGARVGGCDLSQLTPSAMPTTTFDRFPTTAPGISLKFNIRFQSINTKAPNKRIDIDLVSQNGVKQAFKNVVVVSDSAGVYEGEILVYGSGTFEVFVKGKEHLTRRFTGIAINNSVGRVDWTNQELIAGDFNHDNLISSADVALLMSAYTESTTQINSDNTRYDVNADGFLNDEDINIVVSNFNQLEVSGEN